ncbi:hypothetical protein PG994_008260 [Apiospora phragmitis]|uniref:2EXR domain-containing protein n=1 Tax=Apiospora phragmitis TaxID=2905665 RepID=A0ABR1UVN1_9PEZI
MATFHPFPRLPTELRALIWQMTVGPRIVDIQIPRARLRPGEIAPTSNVLASSTLVPAAMQTCREARHQGLYQREFSEVATALAKDAAEYTGQPWQQQDVPYVWLNLDMDMVSIGHPPLKIFLPMVPMIKRLRLARRRWGFYEIEGEDLAAFVNLEQMQIVCLDDLWEWELATKQISWPCGPDNACLRAQVEEGACTPGTELGKQDSGDIQGAVEIGLENVFKFLLSNSV